MNRKQLQRLLIIIFGLAFIGSTAFAIVNSLFTKNTNPTTATENPVASTEETAAKEQLQAQAEGYAKVLEREPENITALTGLVQISLQIGDLPSAIPPLKKLIELNPEQTELNALLTEIEAQLARQPAPINPGSKK